MRPIQLKMTAFGPYKDTETIDFTELEDHQLFVISGQTGSGKTTIFDGICFALYGSASGQDRENNAMLRSDFADDDTHTAVEFIFEQRGRQFRILRQLSHIKQGNKTPTGEKYEFFEVIDGSEVPFVDRQIVSEINEQVEQLIGITQDQFKQIVMLPQGEFRKMLTSETENKEQILRRLFKTEPYQHISDLLRVKKDVIATDFKEAEQRRDHYINHIAATLPERRDPDSGGLENAQLYQVLDEQYYNINQVLIGLDGEISFYRTKVKQDEKNYEQAYKKHDEQQKKFHKAKAVNDRFEELEKKQTELKKLDEQVPLFEKKAEQFQQAERASRMIVYEQQVGSWRQDYIAKRKAVDAAEQAEKNAQSALENITKIHEQEKEKEPKREKIRKQLDQLNEYLPTVKDIDERKSSLTKHRNQLKKQYEQLIAQQNKLKTDKETNAKINEEITALDQAVSEEATKMKQLTEMREKARTIRDYNTFVKRQAELDQMVEKEERTFNKLKKRYESLEQIWLTNQASMLAAHLHDGEACPVCGSEEHPQKASEAEGAITREQLNEARKEFDKQYKIFRDTTGRQQANKEQVTEQAKKVTAYNVALNQAPDVLQQLFEEGKQLKAEVDALEQARKKRDKLKVQHKQTEEAISKLEQEKNKHEQSFQTERTAYERDQAVFEERLRTIPEDVRALKVLEEKITETKATKVAMDKAWEQAQLQLQKAEQQLTRATTNVSNAHNQQKDSATKLAEAEKQFTTALKEAQFSSEEQYEKAKMTEHAQEQLKAEIERFNQLRSTTTKQVEELTKLLENKQKVNLAHLEEQLKLLKSAYEAAFNEHNASKKLLADATQLRKNINEADQVVTKKETELALITDVHDVTRGHNERKISFERYLQIDYLEQIIEAANSRLRNLSNGQFLLQISDRRESHGRQSGLALDVHDAFTGQTRDVKTLSGGEKFNASLCLALGMSDVIQSFQGNVAIDTMFIDEGFGSLDEESLHKAIDTLIDLQETGRMIGVISHVDELKAIFPAVLQVEKTREGYSEANFIIK